MFNIFQNNKKRIENNKQIKKRINKITNKKQKSQMLKSFLQLDLNMKHNKAEYSIKKNKLLLLNKCESKLKNSFQHHRSPATLQQRNSLNMTNSKMKNNIKSIHNEMNNNNSSQFKQSDKALAQEVKFDCITYDPKSTNQKLLYQFLMLLNNKNFISTSNSSLANESQTLLESSSTNNYNNNLLSLTSSQNEQPQTRTLTVTFNYDIEYDSVEQFFTQLMNIKKFHNSQFKIAHYQLRSNHISDYNKSPILSGTKKIKYDQMDSFTKQIDTCIKLDKTWKIKQQINYKAFTKQNYKSKDILNQNNRTNYDKKTNQFFICEIDQLYKINIIVIPRQKDYILTKIEEKQIEEAFILMKNAEVNTRKQQRVSVQFTTSLGKIIQSYLNESDEIVFVSKYPSLNNGGCLEELIHLPLKIDSTRPEQLHKIIRQYNKQTQSSLSLQLTKMKTKLRQLSHKRKQTQQNISYLNKKYKKGFQSIFDSLSYLKNHHIQEIITYKQNLYNQIKEKQEEIYEQLEELKQINQDMIVAEERNQYFKDKMQLLKENLQEELGELDCNFNGGIGSSITSKSNWNQSHGSKTPKVNNKSNPHQIQKKNNKFLSSNNNNFKISTIKPPTSTNIKSPRNNSNNKSSQPFSNSTDIQLAQTILKKILQVEQNQNPYSIQLQRQVDKYTNQLRQKTRQKLLKSKQIDQFHNLMEELRKKLTKQEFTKLQQKYLGLISMC